MGKGEHADSAIKVGNRFAKAKAEAEKAVAEPKLEKAASKKEKDAATQVSARASPVQPPRARARPFLPRALRPNTSADPLYPPTRPSRLSPRAPPPRGCCRPWRQPPRLPAH